VFINSIKVNESDAGRPVELFASGARTAQILAGAQYKACSNGPHGLFITRKDQLNQDLKQFIQGS
jgi:non-heme chloroperoxidase